MHKIPGKIARIKTASDQQKKNEAFKENLKREIASEEAHVRSLPAQFIDLSKHMKIIQETDLKDPDNGFLLTKKLLEPIDLGEEGNWSEKTLSMFDWVDFGGYMLTIIPISDKLRTNRLAVKVLVRCTQQEFHDTEMMVKADSNKAGISLSYSLPLAGFKLQFGKLLSMDSVISSRDLSFFDIPENESINRAAEQNFFTCIVHIHSSNSGKEGMPNIRIQVNYEHELQEVNNYVELQESNFHNLTESRHVHPKDVKNLVHKMTFGHETHEFKGIGKHMFGSVALCLISIGTIIGSIYMSLNTGLEIWGGVWVGGIFLICGIIYLVVVLKIRKDVVIELTKARNLKFIKKNHRSTKKAKYLDAEWIKDFCDISPYWEFNPEENMKIENNIHNIKMS